MKQGDMSSHVLTPDKPADLKLLYDTYADKLLGYIVPIMNNRGHAEDCVVKIFTDISSSKSALPENIWNWLTTLANKQIERMDEAASQCKSVVDNTTYIRSHKYLNRMNELQRRVFCGVYYHRKNTAVLAKELDLPERDLRLRLKEAFMIIREVKDED